MRSNKGFTLAELLVATTIVVIMAAATAFTVGTISTKAAEENIRTRVASSVADLDRGVRDGAIGSYEMTFSSGALGYVSVTDFSGVSASGTLTSFDWVTSAGTFKVSAPVSGQWTVRLAQDNKIVRTVSLPAATASVPFAFDTGRRDSYSASFFYESDPQNRISMTYFDRDNAVSADEARLKFQSAVSSSVEDGSFVLRNVLGKKTFLLAGNPVESATLKFVRGNKEYLVDLAK